MRPSFFPAALLTSALAITALAGRATAQISLQQPGYGLGVVPLGTGPVVVVNPNTLYGGAIQATPRTYLNVAPTGPYPTGTPCDTAQIPTSFTAPPPAPLGTFRPPITPSYSAFRDRFAPPMQPNPSDPTASGCR